jgi:kinesin family member 3B
MQEVSREVEDVYAEWHEEKEQYIDQMRLLHQQMQLKELVIDLFIPIEEVQKVVSQARWDDATETWTREQLQSKRADRLARRPVSASGLRRPTSEFTKSAHAMGDLNPRFRSENILTLELDLPERTTFDFDPDGVTESAQQALNLAFADDDGIMIVGAPENDPPVAMISPDAAPGALERPQSSRQRPSSARRRSSRTH